MPALVRYVGCPPAATKLGFRPTTGPCPWSPLRTRSPRSERPQGGSPETVTDRKRGVWGVDPRPANAMKAARQGAGGKKPSPPPPLCCGCMRLSFRLVGAKADLDTDPSDVPACP